MRCPDRLDRRLSVVDRQAGAGREGAGHGGDGCLRDGQEGALLLVRPVPRVVSMVPGEMAFSRSGASSTASDRVTASTELLVAAAVGKLGFGCRAVTSENTTNDPVFGIVGAKCLASMIGPTTFAWKGSKIIAGLIPDL